MADSDPISANAAQRLARAVLLFHGAEAWTADQQANWLALTGEPAATTRVLCDLARQVRDQTVHAANADRLGFDAPFGLADIDKSLPLPSQDVPSQDVGDG